MYGTGNTHVKTNKPDSERQIPHIFFHIHNPGLFSGRWGSIRRATGKGEEGVNEESSMIPMKKMSQ